MDRRSFFKSFGGVTGAALIPFKWDARETHPKKDPGYVYPCKLFIDGMDYTRYCKSIEVSQGHRATQPTPFGDVEIDSQTYLKTELRGYHNELFEFGEWHMIELQMSSGIVFRKKARTIDSCYRSMEAPHLLHTFLTFYVKEK